MVTNTARTSLEDEVSALYNLDPRVIADPYPLYTRLRTEAPVFRRPEKVLVSRYEDVRAIWTSPHIWQGLAAKGSRYRSAYEQADEQGRLHMSETFGFFEKRLGGANGEDHARLRKLAQRAFTPRMVAQMEQRIVEISSGLLDPLSHDEPIELIEAYAFHLPLMVVCELLDLPLEDRQLLRIWANALGNFVGADWRERTVTADAHSAIVNLRSHLGEVVARRRRQGDTSDLLGALIAAEEEGDRFTEDELIAMIVQFVFAGHETSTMFLGTSLVALLGPFRDQWDLLCQDDEGQLFGAAVEELLRYDSPSQNLDKLAAVPSEIGDVEIGQWETVTVMLGSANRDPDVFPDPDRLDILRPLAAQHLSFGRGAHHCIGAALARLEAKVSLQMLARRFPDMRLATDTVLWRPTHMNRGPEVLPVVLGPERTQ